MTKDLKRLLSTLPEFYIPEESTSSVYGGQESPDLLDGICNKVDGAFCVTLDFHCVTDNRCDTHKNGCTTHYIRCELPLPHKGPAQYTCDPILS